MPSWAVGKTADEVLKMTIALNDTVVRGTPQAPPTPIASPPAPPSPGIDPDLMYRDAAAYTAQVIAEAERRADARIAAASQGFGAPMSSMAREQARTHRPEIWAKYGPEIDTLMAEISGPARLNVDIWKRAVNMVASDHIDEIARERAETLIRSGDVGGLRTSGGVLDPSGASVLSPVRKLFADNDSAIQTYKEAGLTASDVIAHYAKMGKDETKAAETIKNSASRRMRISA